MVEEGKITGTKGNPNTEIIEQKKFGVTVPGTPEGSSDYVQNIRAKKK